MGEKKKREIRSEEGLWFVSPPFSSAVSRREPTPLTHRLLQLSYQGDEYTFLLTAFGKPL